MKWIKHILYLVIVVLILEVLKTVITKLAFSSSFFVATIIISLQFFCIIIFFLFIAFFGFSKKYPVRQRVLLTITGILALITIIELTLGYWLNRPKFIPVSLVWATRFYYDQNMQLIQYKKEASVYNPHLFYTLRPNSTFLYAGREFNDQFQINSKGLRDDEASLESPELICLGDSYAMGWGVQQQKTFAQDLELMSGKKVLNAGISSYGTAREMILLNELDTSALKFLIIQYCSNDFDENLSYINSEYTLSISSEKYYDSLVNSQQLVNLYFPGKYLSSIAMFFLKHKINRVYPLFNLESNREKPFKDEKRQAETFLNVLCSSSINFNKVKVIVTVMESYPRMKNNFLQEVDTLSRQSPFKERLGKNLLTVDVSGELSQEDFYILDLHINSSGHHKVAQKIWEIIQQE